jgi:PilZ domain
MGQRDLEQEYQLILSEGFATGELRIRTEAPDLREAPRFHIQQGRIGVRLEPQLLLVDVSASGIAFLSEVPFPPGSVLQVILKDTVAFQARVVACQLVETDIDYLEVRYRVQCRFSDSINGKHLLVLMKEMERIGVSGTVN